MKRILFITLFSLISFVFTQDLESPYYINHPIYGAGIQLTIPGQIEIQNSMAQFEFGFWNTAMEWEMELEPEESEMLNEWFQESEVDPMMAFLDDGSGVQKYGLRLISPSGNIHEAFAQPVGMDFGFAASGNWGEYITDACCDCGIEMGMCMEYQLYLSVPSNLIESGLYEINFVVTDFAGNELVISGDELEGLGASSTIEFIGGENLDDLPPYYVSHPTYGPSIQISIPSEIQIENSIASFNVGFQPADWVYSEDVWLWFESMGYNEQSLISDDGSGLQKFGLRLISPSGIVNNAFLEQNWNMSYESSGNWADYIVDGMGECMSGGGGCLYFDFNMNIPDYEVEYGVYEASFVFIDFAGNELIIEGEELEYLGASSAINFSGTNSVDDTPPYYEIHPDYGASVELYGIPSELEIENSIASFDIGFGMESWVDQEWDDSPLYLFNDDGSGVHKFGIRMIAPSGDTNEAFIEPGFEFDYSSSGNWAQYINFAMGECGEWFGSCTNYGFSLIIPVNELELGTYVANFVVIDYAGNELVIQGDEIQNLGVSPTMTIIDSESNINIENYGDIPILNWGWGLFQLVLIDSDALSGLEEGAEIYVLDELGIPDEGCDGDFGPIIVGYNTYQGEMETPYELVCGEGLDLCGFNGPRLPGYVEGSTMKIYADNNGSTLEGEVTDYSLGEGTFGEPLTYITGINFTRSEVELSDINLLESSDTRNQYKYNVYRNEELYLSAFQSVYYIDEDINDNTDYCYEVYLIDNYDNSEFLATEQVCFYSESDFLFGDVTQDGSVNVLDVVSIVAYILGSQEYSDAELQLADYTQDGSVNVLDVVAIVQIILE